MKFGWEVRAGTRIDTGFVQPRAFPATNGALDAFEIEVYVARRFHRRPSLGLDLSAWAREPGHRVGVLTMGLMSLLMATAFAAQTPSVGHVVLAPSADARIRILPRTDPQWVQVGIFENVLDLEPQVTQVAAQWLLDLKAESIGSGAWFLTFYVENEHIDVDWRELEDGRVRFELAPNHDVHPSPECACPVVGQPGEG